MYKSYQEIEKNAKTIQSKLKKSIEKARWVVSDIEIIGIDISNIFPMELPDIPCLLLYSFFSSIDVHCTSLVTINQQEVGQRCIQLKSTCRNFFYQKQRTT